IQPGDVTVSPAGVETSYSLAKRGRHLCIHFMPQRRTHNIISLPLHIRLGYRTQQAAELFSQVSVAFMQYKMTGSDYAKLSASSCLQRLLAYLAEFVNSGDDRAVRGLDYSVAERLAGIIDSEYVEPLSVPALARRAGMSQNYLARLFRVRYGVTIPRYILTVRIEKAKELLEITNLKVGCVGQYVGLRDPHYFNKMFRKLAGMNPSEYRKISRVDA
ncbi:MAG TPA: AraC family transcriptional regulator, partial [Phycisphaerae bacterium]|nr:AraC family transcriptional regulator [Phycisphaerae bacterium]